jgi:hypothetical protein
MVIGENEGDMSGAPECATIPLDVEAKTCRGIDVEAAGVLRCHRRVGRDVRGVICPEY